MVVITKENFSIRQICESGQCFRLEKLEESDSINCRKERFSLTALGRYLEME